MTKTTKSKNEEINLEELKAKLKISQINFGERLK
jgi:hypothetical protein